jgi:solute carrier family 38 (sodium-coupled neutral amino acid transporter), member 11
LADRTLWILICVIFVCLPLSLLESVSFLENFSFLSICTEICLVLLVIYECILTYVKLALGDESVLIKGFPLGLDTVINTNFFGAVGILSLAFACHHNSFLLYSALDKPTLNRFFFVNHLSLGASMLVLLTMGFFGAM